VPRPALEPTKPPTEWVLGALSPGIKWLKHEANHSHPSSAEAKNGGGIPPFPHVFIVWCLITLAQGQLYIFLTLQHSTSQPSRVIRYRPQLKNYMHSNLVHHTKHFPATLMFSVRCTVAGSHLITIKMLLDKRFSQ
jgi:hypothetical protein